MKAKLSEPTGGEAGTTQTLSRRGFLAGSATVLAAGAGMLIAGCTSQTANTNSTPPALPAPNPDPNSDFGVDININMTTIDNWLSRDDVAYRDMRMLVDPAKFSDIGGESDLDNVLIGAMVIPYPYLASLPELPVSGAYSGNKAFTLTWNADGSIATATPNYKEATMILDDLFPKDKAIFICCGGGGYAAMAKALLIFMGWDANKLYNIGGMWTYEGPNVTQLVVYSGTGDMEKAYATWRANYAYIDFDLLNPVS